MTRKPKLSSNINDVIRKINKEMMSENAISRKMNDLV